MKADSQPHRPAEMADEPVVLQRGHFRRLRAGWMLLGAGTAMGAVGGILRNSWLLSGCLIAFAAIVFLNRAILKGAGG